MHGYRSDGSIRVWRVPAAGYDLYSAEEVLVPAFGRILVKTDIAVLVPEGDATE